MYLLAGGCLGHHTGNSFGGYRTQRTDDRDGDLILLQVPYYPFQCLLKVAGDSCRLYKYNGMTDMLKVETYPC